MSQSRIRTLLETRLRNWASARTPKLPVAWENVSFDPVEPMWIAATLLPAGTTSEDLAGQHRGYLGTLQVSVVCPPGTGAAAAQGIAEEIAALYPNNLRLEASGFAVQVIRPAQIAAAVQGSDSYSIPVSVSYRSDTTA